MQEPPDCCNVFTDDHFIAWVWRDCAVADLIHHVGISEDAIALAVPRKVEAQAAQARLGERLCELRQHEAVLVVSQAMAEDGNLLRSSTVSSGQTLESCGCSCPRCTQGDGRVDEARTL